MLLKKINEDNFIDVTSVKKYSDSFQEVGSMKRWAGTDWIEVYPDINRPDGMLGRVLDKLLWNYHKYSIDYNNENYGPYCEDPLNGIFTIGIQNRSKTSSRKQRSDTWRIRAKNYDTINIVGATNFQCTITSISGGYGSALISIGSEGSTLGGISCYYRCNSSGVFQTPLQRAVPSDYDHTGLFFIETYFSNLPYHDYYAKVNLKDIIFF